MKKLTSGAMRSKNACKTCALGMGGQKGGMVNEAGRFPGGLQEVAAGHGRRHAGGIQPEFWSTYSIAQLQKFSPRELESCGRLTAGVLEQAAVLPADQLGRSPLADRGKLRSRRARRTFWYFSGRSERSGLSAAALRPALRHQQRQQLQLLLPSGQRRGADVVARQRHGDAHARRRRACRSGLRHRRQSRPAIIRG
jgi:hypothetical protein